MTPAPLPPPRQPGCPSDLDLELLLAKAPAQVQAHGAHAEGCASCKERLAWADDAGRHFLAAPFARTREAVVERAVGGRRPWLDWRAWVPALSLAAAVLLAVVFVPSGPGPDYVGRKGGGAALGLEVWRGVDGRGERVASGAQVHPGDGLRFSVLGGARRVWVFTVDARGNVSLLTPAPGAVPAEPSGVLPGGAVLDDVLGPERVFAVDAEAVPTFEALEALVRRTYGADPATIRSVETLPLQGLQDSVLLEKVAP